MSRSQRRIHRSGAPRALRALAGQRAAAGLADGRPTPSQCLGPRALAPTRSSSTKPLARLATQSLGPSSAHDRALGLRDSIGYRAHETRAAAGGRRLTRATLCGATKPPRATHRFRKFSESPSSRRSISTSQSFKRPSSRALFGREPRSLSSSLQRQDGRSTAATVRRAGKSVRRRGTIALQQSGRPTATESQKRAHVAAACYDNLWGDEPVWRR